MGQCVPHSKASTLMPMVFNHDSTAEVWAGSELCEAHESATSRSLRLKWLAAPETTVGRACRGFEDERG